MSQAAPEFRHPDYLALIADQTFDVIDICTPPARHATMIVATVQAGRKAGRVTL
jgi:predicted dehydrogenase